MMKSILLFFIVHFNVLDGQQMNFWLTDPDKNILFEEQTPLVPTTSNDSLDNDLTIKVNTSEKYQTIDGFGFALTGGSALLLNNLDNTTRTQILHELFSTDGNSIGTSYLRISIGSSDLDESVFSYDDLPKGHTDVNLTHFTLDRDRMYLIPVLKQILQINPQMKILGSPWSPPAWMKTNDETKGGHLLKRFYDTYANYFVRYVEGMKGEGIPIDAITIQNEPLYGGNNPSMVMDAQDQKEFIVKHLGPAFKKYSIDTKIFIYDHNPDRPDYALTILADQQARQYVDGSAFHMYAGSIDVLSLIHAAHPDKNLYFTEQWVGAPGNLKTDLAWHIKTLIVGATRNWARNVIEWNLASDSKWEPHTPGGCDNCLGALTIDGNLIHSPRNPSYYIIAHAAKFVRPNSTRIGSNILNGFANVAFQRSEDQRKVLVVLNEQDQSQTFQISSDGKTYSVQLNGGAVGTFVW